MKIGQKIYQLRRQLGLSQEALAERVSVTRQAVSKWELDTSVPELETVVALARTFGVTTDYLLSDEDTAPRQEEAAPSTAPQQDWLARLPGFIGKLFRRFGWLGGVYLAVVGAMFTAVGAIARRVVRQMFFGFSGTLPTTDDPFIQQLQNAVTNNPINIMGSFIMILGIVLLVGGVILAVYLKKKNSPSE